MAAEASAREPSERDVAHRDHRRIQIVLRAGMIGAALLMFAGTVVAFAGDAVVDAPPVRLFHLGDSSDVPTLCTALGVAMLTVTPAARVVALTLLWWRERDWRFVAVSLVVIVTLAIAIALGHG